MTITHDSGHSGSSTTTADITTSNVNMTEGNLQVLYMAHRTAPQLPEITAGATNWIGPFECCAEVQASSQRRSIWMWYREVPASAGTVTIGFASGADFAFVINEYATTESSGTWRLDSSPAGGVWEQERSDTRLTDEGSTFGQDSAAAVTSRTVNVNTEGFATSALMHRHGDPSNSTEHSVTAWDIRAQANEGGGGQNNLSLAVADEIATGDQSAAWSWSTTTNHVVTVHAFSYDTATASSGTLANPTVKISGTSTTDIADGSSTINAGSFLPVAGRLYLMAVHVHITSDEDDFLLNHTANNGLDFVMRGWFPGDGVDAGWAVYAALAPSTGLSNSSITFDSWGDTGETVDRVQWVVIEVDGVDDTGHRASGALVQQDDPANNYSHAFSATTGTAGTLDTAGDGHIVFWFWEDSTTGSTGRAPETGWTNLHERIDTSPLPFEMYVDYDFTSPTTTAPVRDWAENTPTDSSSFILAIKAAAAAGDTDAPAGEAAGTGAGQQGTAKVEPNGGQADSTGTAQQATADIDVNGGEAPGTGAGHQAGTDVKVNAGVATGTGTGQQPSTDIKTNVDVANGTGTAENATVITGTLAPAGLASGTGTGVQPNTDLDANAGEAAGTGTGENATALTGTLAPAGEAAGTGTGLTAATDIDATAGEAAGTGTGEQPTADLDVPAGEAAGTGTAYNATVDVEEGTEAPAEVAPGTGTALQPVASVFAQAGVATGTGTSADVGQIDLEINAEAASGTGTALAVVIELKVNAAIANLTGIANNPSALTAGAAEPPGGRPTIDVLNELKLEVLGEFLTVTELGPTLTVEVLT